jgi:hypothetical protein
MRSPKITVSGRVISNPESQETEVAASLGGVMVDGELFDLVPNPDLPNPSLYREFEFDNVFGTNGVLRSGLLFENTDKTKSARFVQVDEVSVVMEVRLGDELIRNSTGALTVLRLSSSQRAAVIVYLPSPSSRVVASTCKFGGSSLLIGFGVFDCNATEMLGSVLPGHPLVACQRCFPGIFNLRQPAFGTLTFSGVTIVVGTLLQGFSNCLMIHVRAARLVSDRIMLFREVCTMSRITLYLPI